MVSLKFKLVNFLLKYNIKIGQKLVYLLAKYEADEYAEKNEKFDLRTIPARIKKVLLYDTDIIEARLVGTTHNIDYTVDEDVYPHIGVDRDPIELTDDEMLDEQRKEANKQRFRMAQAEDDDLTDDQDRVRKSRILK